MPENAADLSVISGLYCCWWCGAPVKLGSRAGYEFNEWDVLCSAYPDDHGLGVDERDRLKVRPVIAADDYEGMKHLLNAAEGFHPEDGPYS